MGGVILSNKHGINPTCLKCEQCGKDTNALALMGRASKLECNKCKAIVYGRATSPAKCPQCGNSGRGYDVFHTLETDVEAPKNLTGGLCDECIAKHEEAKAEVERGGIYWVHEACGSEGAIKAESKLSIDVRKQTKIEAPDPVGIKFEKEQCPVCSEK